MRLEFVDLWYQLNNYGLVIKFDLLHLLLVVTLAMLCNLLLSQLLVVLERVRELNVVLDEHDGLLERLKLS